MSEHLRLAFEIDFGIDVGDIDRDVAEPSTHGVDVHASAEQVCGGSVTTIPGEIVFVPADRSLL